VETRRLNEQVKRNIDRFPADFMFQLTVEEFENLKSQFATLSWGGRRKLPKILLIFEFLKQLEQVKQQELEQRSRKRVGFKRMNED